MRIGLSAGRLPPRCYHQKHVASKAVGGGRTAAGGSASGRGSGLRRVCAGRGRTGAAGHGEGANRHCRRSARSAHRRAPGPAGARPLVHGGAGPCHHGRRHRFRLSRRSSDCDDQPGRCHPGAPGRRKNRANGSRPRPHGPSPGRRNTGSVGAGGQRVWQHREIRAFRPACSQKPAACNAWNRAPPACVS